jgi:hypothetical protein
MVRIARQFASEPTVILAAAGAVTLRGWFMQRADLGLLLLAAIVSAALGIMVAVQIGANVNYVFEAFFLCTPLAVAGLTRLGEEGKRGSTMSVHGAVLAGLLVVYGVLPIFVQLRDSLQHTDRNAAAGSAQEWNHFGAALRGRKLFTTVPRVALLTDDPVITDPFLHAVLEKVGRRDTREIADGVRRGDYEVVATLLTPLSWRGLPHVTQSISDAIETTYIPVCTVLGAVVHLPRAMGQPESRATLESALEQAGCRQVVNSGSGPAGVAASQQ